MREISAAAYEIMQANLVTLEEQIKELERELEAAVSQGDLSENTEYDIAKSDLAEKKQKYDEISQIIRTAKIKQTYSNTISAGSLIRVELLGENDSIEEDWGLLMFDEVGDLVFEGRITPDSGLGSAIQGGVTGIYVVQDGSGKPQRFRVTLEPETVLPEFMEKWSGDRKKRMMLIFSGD